MISQMFEESNGAIGSFEFEQNGKPRFEFASSNI